MLRLPIALAPPPPWLLRSDPGASALLFNLICSRFPSLYSNNMETLVCHTPSTSWKLEAGPKLPVGPAALFSCYTSLCFLLHGAPSHPHHFPHHHSSGINIIQKSGLVAQVHLAPCFTQSRKELQNPQILQMNIR